MKKQICLLLLIALLLSGCSGADERSWLSGQKALAEENYSEASAAFEKAGAFQDADQLKQYADAWQLLESGEYASAAEIFRSLQDLKDSPLMVSYCLAREQEAVAENACAGGDADAAANACREAAGLYSSLSLFRDSDDRVAACRSQLYEKSTEWMSLGSYREAASGYAALGDYQDSSGLQRYCSAAQLMQQGSFMEAADLFSQIPEVLDSPAQADTARSRAYQAASDLRDSGDYESAVRAFDALSGYQDAEAQRDSTLVFLIRSLLGDGSFNEALQKLSLLADSSPFPAADSAQAEDLDIWLKSVLSAWLNAHAGVMSGFFSRSLLQGYIEPGGELDIRLQAELPDDMPHENYGYVFNDDGRVEELLSLDEGFLAARVQGTASYYGPNASGNAMNETLLILVDIRGNGPIAAAVLPL